MRDSKAASIPDISQVFEEDVSRDLIDEQLEIVLKRIVNLVLLLDEYYEIAPDCPSDSLDRSIAQKTAELEREFASAVSAGVIFNKTYSIHCTTGVCYVLNLTTVGVECHKVS